MSVAHNIRPRLSMNQSLSPIQATRLTTMEQVEGKLCRIQMCLDSHFPAGHPAVRKLIEGFQELEEADPNALESITLVEAETRLPVELVLGNFAYHIHLVATMPVPGKLRFSCLPGMDPIEVRSEKLSNGPDWYHVNGVSCGNVHGAISAVSVLVAPYLRDYFRMIGDLHGQKAAKEDDHYYTEQRERLYATLKVKPRED